MQIFILREAPPNISPPKNKPLKKGLFGILRYVLIGVHINYVWWTLLRKLGNLVPRFSLLTFLAP